MAGNSPEMWKLYSKIQRVAPHCRMLLLRGATGTGKKLVAPSLHHLSEGSSRHHERRPPASSKSVETSFATR